MARKTGTVTGASLDPKDRKKAKAESSTPIADAASEVDLNKFADSIPQTESTSQPTPSSVVEKLQEIGSSVASTVEKGTKVASAVQGIASRIGTAIQTTDNDRNTSAITNGKVNTSEILSKASATIDENVPQLDAIEATKRKTIIARQRNFVSVAIDNTKLQQDIQTLDNEQQKLIGLLIDGKTARVNNETKAIGFHRAITKRDTELSALEEDRELLVHQQIKTDGTIAQTPLVQKREQLKVEKMKEEIEKLGVEIDNISSDKEKIKREAELKFANGF